MFPSPLQLIMDLVTEVLSFVPVPPLSIAFSIFKFIFQHVQRAQASKEQLTSLTFTIAQLLLTLNSEYKAGRLVESKTATSLNNFSRFVQFSFAKRQSPLR
jgi:hypothetical protein